MASFRRAVPLISKSIGDKSNPCLLMISGKSCTMNMWRGIPEKIANAGFHVITFDNRDMGLSQQFPDIDAPAELTKHREGKPYSFPYTLDDMADDAIQVLDDHQVAQAHVLGASLGGVIAQIVANRHTSRILSLTSIMSALDINHWAGVGFTANIDFFMKILTSPPPTADMSLQEFIDNRVAVWSVLLTDAAHPELSPAERDLLIAEMTIDYLRQGYDVGDLGGMRQMLATNAWVDQQLASHKQSLQNLSAMKKLVLHGKHDKLLPQEAANELVAAMPGARLALYEGGHNLPLDQHDFIVNAIVEHIR